MSSITEVLNLPGCHDVNLEENGRRKEKGRGRRQENRRRSLHKTFKICLRVDELWRTVQ